MTLVNFSSLSAVPEITMSSAANMKKGIAISVNVSIPVNILCAKRYSGCPLINKYIALLNNMANDNGVPENIKIANKANMTDNSMLIYFLPLLFRQNQELFRCRFFTLRDIRIIISIIMQDPPSGIAR